MDQRRPVCAQLLACRTCVSSLQIRSWWSCCPKHCVSRRHACIASQPTNASGQHVGKSLQEDSIATSLACIGMVCLLQIAYICCNTKQQHALHMQVICCNCLICCNVSRLIAGEHSLSCHAKAMQRMVDACTVVTQYRYQASPETISSKCVQCVLMNVMTWGLIKAFSSIYKCRFEGPKCDIDINECVRGTDNCAAEAACINTVGALLVASTEAVVDYLQSCISL